MAHIERSDFCKHCDETVLVRAKSPNHILHLVLSILTCGVWLIVWLWLCLQPKDFRCSKCGRRLTMPRARKLSELFSGALAQSGELVVDGFGNIEKVDDKTVLYVPTGAKWAGTAVYDKGRDKCHVELAD